MESDYISVPVSEELYDQLEKRASRLGLSIEEFIRLKVESRDKKKDISEQQSSTQDTISVITDHDSQTSSEPNQQLTKKYSKKKGVVDFAKLSRKKKKRSKRGFGDAI